MEVERIFLDFFMEFIFFDETIFFKTIENFNKFLPSRLLFRPNIVVVLLNVSDAINFVDTFEENNSRIRLFTLDSFFHGIDFAGEKAGEFVGVIATIESNFFVNFF